MGASLLALAKSIYYRAFSLTWSASMQTYGNKQQRKFFTEEKSPTPSGFLWNTNKATVSLFWNTNMAAVTSCENALLATFGLPRS